MSLWALGAISALLLSGCASSRDASPGPAAPSASAKGRGTVDALDAFDAFARAVPVQFQGGQAFITLSRKRRFELGVLLSRPNFVGIGVTSRWR